MQTRHRFFPFKNRRKKHKWAVFNRKNSVRKYYQTVVPPQPFGLRPPLPGRLLGLALATAAQLHGVPAPGTGEALAPGSIGVLGDGGRLSHAAGVWSHPW